MSGVGESASGLRLAIYTDTYLPQVNGVSRTLAGLAAAVERRGGAVRIETVEDPAARGAEPGVVRWPSLPFWAYPQLRIAAPPGPQVTAGLALWRPTLVHASTPFGVGLAGRAAAHALGVPFVTSYHTAFSAYLRHYRLGALDAIAWPYLRWFHNGGRRTFAPSRLVAEELSKLGFRGVRTWSRGVDPVRFHPRFRSEGMRAAMGAGPDDFVVAYVGRLAPEKGVHVAIAAMSSLMAAEVGTARSGPPRPSTGRLRFALAGDGPDEARCRETAPAGTWFAGALNGEALSAFYASADAFVFPSTTETFGNVVLEAMASGVPVIAPDVGATLELASDVTAVTFRAGDPESLAQQVARLRGDPAMHAQKRVAGLDVAASRSWEAVWDRLILDYREALAAGATAVGRVA
ncbi:MAG TPA: glycosyltransferase family 1 protein [Gemmatimonadaceae bacterium]|nr:glycosyltransferase family 1 protein [Gemmatimonadaceae bacterium]